MPDISFFWISSFSFLPFKKFHFGDARFNVFLFLLFQSVSAQVGALGHARKFGFGRFFCLFCFSGARFLG